MGIARCAALATLILALSACGTGSGDASEKPGTVATTSASPTAPTSQPAITGTGAVMPLKPSEAPIDWKKVELDGGAYSVSLPDGYEIIAEGGRPKDAGNVAIVAQFGSAVSLAKVKSDSERAGSFTKMDGYVPANATFPWPRSDGASYVRQNVKGVIATGFVISVGKKSLIFAASTSGPDGSSYDQNTVDRILSTARVN